MRRLAVALAAATLAQEPEAPVRLLLLAGARTGSSLLVSTLRKHPEILCHGEVFHEKDLRRDAKDGFDGGVFPNDALFGKRHTDPGALLDFMARNPMGRRAVAFKLFSEHLEWQRLPRVLRWATHVRGAASFPRREKKERLSTRVEAQSE